MFPSLRPLNFLLSRVVTVQTRLCSCDLVALWLLCWPCPSSVGTLTTTIRKQSVPSRRVSRRGPWPNLPCRLNPARPKTGESEADGNPRPTSRAPRAITAPTIMFDPGRKPSRLRVLASNVSDGRPSAPVSVRHVFSAASETWCARGKSAMA